MSQRREKQLRKLERRVSALENLAMPTITDWQDKTLDKLERKEAIVADG